MVAILCRTEGKENKINRSRNRRIVFILATGGLLTLVMILLAFRPIRAAGPWYVASGGDDGNDCLSPGTACATMNGAIGKASGGDTIYVSVGTYTGTGDEVVLLGKDITLSGGWDISFTTQSGASTIDGEGSHRGVTVNGSVTAIVDRFTVQNGFSNEGGGINNGGTLTLNNSTVSSNVSSSAVDTHGGGIYNDDGTLTLNDSTVSSNTSNGFGGGIHNETGTLNLNNSTVSGNTATHCGGGIDNSQGTLALDNSTVSGNDGGGLCIDVGNVTLSNTTVSGNSGQGIANESAIVTLSNTTVSGNQQGILNETGTLNLNNSTVSGNTPGGGIHNGYHGTVTLNNSTVSGNTRIGEGGGIQSGGTVALQNTILAGNTASQAGPDCSGEIGSLGYNLVGDTSDCTFAATTGDLGDVDAKLFSLFDLPGYHPLWPDSPAIDAGNPTGCTDHLGDPLTTDQRGTPRPWMATATAMPSVTLGATSSIQSIRSSRFTCPSSCATTDPCHAPATWAV